MFKLNEMPTNADGITIEWLTDVLKSSGAIGEAAVVDMVVEPLSGAGYIGLVARVRPIYNSPDIDAPTSLIFKYSSSDPSTRKGLQGLYAREVLVYQQLSDQIDLPTATCYHAAFDPETGHSILLLEDLAHLRQRDIVQGCQPEEIEAVVTQLAQHHAQWWEDPRLKQIDFLKPTPNITPDGEAWFQSVWDEYEDKIAQASPDCYLPAAYLDLGHTAVRQMMAFQEEFSRSPFTLIHNDMHLDNLLFSNDPDDAAVTFIDWQGCGYGLGVSDITYFMIFSVPLALRRRVEHEMIRLYHETLMSNGVTNYSFAQCWRDYRLSFFWAFTVSLFWVTIADLSRPHAQSKLSPLITRLVSFAEDHCVSEFLS